MKALNVACSILMIAFIIFACWCAGENIKRRTSAEDALTSRNATLQHEIDSLTTLYRPVMDSMENWKVREAELKAQLALKQIRYITLYDTITQIPDEKIDTVTRIALDTLGAMRSSGRLAPRR